MTTIGNKREDLVYALVVSLLLLTMTGIGYMRYAIYMSPFAAVLIWVASGKPTISINRAVAPFFLLLVLGFLTLFDYDYNVFKKTYFIFAYVWIFLLFDFSKVEIDYRKLSVLLVAMMFLRLIVSGDLSALKGLQFSVMDSKSFLESTMAFPIGMVALYFFIAKRYVWFALMLAVSIFALKRVVLLALVVAVLAMLIPKKIRNKIVNPFTVTTGLVIALVLIIQFSLGSFDSYIFEYTGLAPNDFSKGRQHAWLETLRAVNYSFENFILWGVGLGKVVTELQKIYGQERILLHSDLLGIMLEGGYLILVVFLFTLNWLKSYGERVMALFLSVIFLTDNVVIYQHVMLTYLLIQSSLARMANQENQGEGSDDLIESPAHSGNSEDRILRRAREK